MIPEKFLQVGATIMQNPALLQELAGCKNPSEAYALLEGFLGGMSKEEFITAAKTFAPMIPAGLTDEQLDAMPAGPIIRAFKNWINEPAE